MQPETNIKVETKTYTCQCPLSSVQDYTMNITKYYIIEILQYNVRQIVFSRTLHKP